MPEVQFESPIFDNNNRQDLPPSITGQPQSPRSPKSFFGRKVVIFFGTLVTVTIVLVSLVVIRNSKPDAPKSENVFVTIKGPETLASGNEAEYAINYKNGENADLLGLSMEVFYPTNFKFTSADPKPKSSGGQAFDLPVLRQGQDGEIKIRGKLTGKIDEKKEIRARLHYRLSNFNSDFTTEGSHTTSLTAPNLVLEITGPIDVTNGQDTTFSVEYSNVSSQDFDNIILQVGYPAGFKFVNSNPAPSKNNNVWSLGKLAAGAKGKIDLSGSFTGDPSQEKLVVAELGVNINGSFAPQITSSVAFKIVTSSLTITQIPEPDDSVKLGDKIDYTINYANYGSVGMTNVVVSVTLEGPAIDYSNFKVNNAITTGNTLTWKSATVKNLALLSPNQEGEINFSLPLKKSLSSNVKNQVVKGTAVIYSDQVKNPIRAQDVEIKLASELGLLVSGKYVSGALPMQVGQATTFSITMLVTNLSNDLQDVEVIGSIPLPDTAWKNVVIPDSEKDKVFFDINANKVRWKVGNLAAFVGKFSPAHAVTFYLEVVPGFADKGSTIGLIRDVQASGRDSFVNIDLESTRLNEYRTSDIDDIDSNVE